MKFTWYLPANISKGAFFFLLIKVVINDSSTELLDHYTFLENYPPTPPLSQLFALSER